MTAFDKNLPKPISHFTDFYGTVDVPDNELLLVLHYAVMNPSNALGLANYCHTNPNGYRWHESIGSDGSCYRCGKIGEIGAHDSGINSKSYGIETTAMSGTQMRAYPKLMNQLARRSAQFCHDTKRKPSRDFIIGHYEDAKFGGTSTHIDVTPGWDWSEFMDLTNQHYDDLGGDMALDRTKDLPTLQNMLMDIGLVQADSQHQVFESVNGFWDWVRNRTNDPSNPDRLAAFAKLRSLSSAAASLETGDELSLTVADGTVITFTVTKKS